MYAHSFINFWIQNTAQPISIIINHKFITPAVNSTLREFSLSQNRHPILAQPNFHTLYKSGQCSPKHELFSIFFLVSYDRWDLQPYIHMKISRKCFTVFIWQIIQKCQLFFRHPVEHIVSILNSSKKKWKSEFDKLLLSYLSNNRCMLGIIRKIVKFSVKRYPTCYDYGFIIGGAVLWNVG